MEILRCPVCKKPLKRENLPCNSDVLGQKLDNPSFVCENAEQKHDNMSFVCESAGQKRDNMSYSSENVVQKHDNMSYICENGHLFDIAKEGYCNLLLSSAKNSKNPGDNKIMVDARHNFLKSNAYLPLAKKLAQCISEYENTEKTRPASGLCVPNERILEDIKADETHSASGLCVPNECILEDIKADETHSASGLCVLDAGVGTGYYMSIISQERQAQGRKQLPQKQHIDSGEMSQKQHTGSGEMSQKQHTGSGEMSQKQHTGSGEISKEQLINEQYANGFENDRYFGIDISKLAVKIAAKENKCASLFVGSVFDLPFEDSSFDVVLCVFSPFAIAEYLRVLKTHGALFVVTPSENHLLEIRKFLYAENTRQVETKLPLDGLKVEKVEKISFEIDLNDSASIAALLEMTPYFYRAPKAAVDRLLQLNELTTEADFNITIVRKY